MNTVENNKLIAEFMGNTMIAVNIPFEYEVGEELPTSGNICKDIVDAQEEVLTELDEGVINGQSVLLQTPTYDTSWDWLMPVVEKIEIIEWEGKSFEFYIVGKGCFLNDKPPTTFGETKIEATYKAVVEFIKWYNKNQA